jgi:hypothetical protein
MLISTQIIVKFSIYLIISQRGIWQCISSSCLLGYSEIIFHFNICITPYWWYFRFCFGNGGCRWKGLWRVLKNLLWIYTYCKICYGWSCGDECGFILTFKYVNSSKIFYKGSRTKWTLSCFIPSYANYLCNLFDREFVLKLIFKHWNSF